MSTLFIEALYKLGFTLEMTNPIESLRLKLGLTMQQLADLAGTTAPQINKLEKGYRDLDKKWATRLAPYLGVTAQELMFPMRGKFKQPTVDYKNLQEAPVYGVSSARKTAYAIDKDSILMQKPVNPLTMGKNGFYVKVVGDAMEPLFEEGHILAVNPDYPLMKGKPCLIETINNETLVRRYVGKTARTVKVEQLNPAEAQSLKLAEIVRISRIVGQEF